MPLNFKKTWFQSRFHIFFIKNGIKSMSFSINLDFKLFDKSTLRKENEEKIQFDLALINSTN